MDIYARLSHAADGSEINVDDQIEQCEERLAARGAVPGQRFKDNSLSAWNPKVVRKDFNRLMGRLESGASDGVIVLDLTRFTRKIMEGERLVELAKRGIRVWSCSGEYDLTTADGRRHFREAMVAAAGESDKISERVKGGKRRRAKMGLVAGGLRGFAMPGWAPPRPGWKKGEPRERAAEEIVNAERAVVAECYRRLLAGETVAGLVRDLNARGITSTQGKPWQRSQLPRVLTRPSMAGLVEHNGVIVGKRTDMEPIVSTEDWERLCAIVDGRKRGRPKGAVHVLSGRIACGQCGQPLFGMARRTSMPYPDGSPKREYRCRRDPETGGCGRNHIDALAAEQAVAVAVKRRLGDPRRAERMAAHSANIREEGNRIRTDITRWEESADTLAEKTAEWGMERVEKAMAPILKNIATLKAELAALDEPETADVAAADAANTWDLAAERGDVDTLRSLIGRAFPHLTLIASAKRGDHSMRRFDWDGTTGPTAS